MAKENVTVNDAALKELEQKVNALLAEKVVHETQIERMADNYRNLELANARPYIDGATLARALAKAQSAITNIGKDKEVDFPTKQGGKVKFSYATLAAIMAVVRKPLTDNGLSITQFPTFNFEGANSAISVRTRLTHECGEFIENTIVLPCLDRKPSEIGIIISYARRYGVTSLLGLAQVDETGLEEMEADQRFVGMEAPPLEGPPATTTRPSPPATQRAPVKKVSMVELGISLQSSATMEELTAASKAVAAAKESGQITAQQREDLASVYSKRKKEIEAGIPDNLTGKSAESAPNA